MKNSTKQDYLIITIMFLIVLFGSTAKVLSQNNSKIDSLLNITKQSDNDSLVMEAYNKLRRATYYKNQKESQKYTFKYLEYARKIKDSNKIVLGHFYIGNSQVTEAKYNEATKNYLIAASYYKAKEDFFKLSSVYNSLGTVNEKIKNDSLSLEYYFASRKLSIKLKDYRRKGIASVNIGNIYANKKELKKAIFYLEDGAETFKIDATFKPYLNLAEISLANAYFLNGENYKSLDLYKKLNTELDTIKELYNYGRILIGLAKIYKKQKLPELALKNGQHAYRIYTENNYVDECLDLMPDLIVFYRDKNRDKDALKIYDKYQKLKDSLLSENNNKQITDAIQKYETEKKDAELKVLKLESEKSEQEKILYIIMAFTLLSIAVIIAFFLHKNYKKNKLLAKQTKLLEASIDEKNVLLKETHHRVKNSFQIVSSLLYLQSESVEDKEAKIAIKEAENRVKSMVLIHQKLYNKEELVGINTKEYFEDLVTDIFESHQDQFKLNTITYNLNVDPLILDIETITPIGLILNELIVNTIKHAFTTVTPTSNINVLFKKVDDNLLLTVKDNGKGFSGEIKNTSFGITLMKALSKKLKATLTYQSKVNQGTAAKLVITKFKVL